MHPRRGFVMRELAALIVAAAAAGSILLAMAPDPDGLNPRTLENLRSISQGAHFYRLANNNYLPITLTYTPRGSAPRPGNQMVGWCAWSFGGKNNSPWWYSATNGIFDVEAADRPLNSYVLPEEPFYAPEFPQRLPASHPTRLTAQAEMFRDPGDNVSFQRSWPTPNPKITGYNDVGTSYLTNWAWWDQLGSISSFQQRYAEGARRIAVGEGVNPARFVWLTDHYGDILWGSSNSRFRIRNGNGDVNFAPLLFLDGHATYEYITPRRLTTPTYTFLFE